MRDQAVTVNYRTAGVTATENTDYDGDSDTLTFEPGDTRKTIESSDDRGRYRRAGRDVHGDAERPERRHAGRRHRDGDDQ